MAADRFGTLDCAQRLLDAHHVAARLAALGARIDYVHTAPGRPATFYLAHAGDLPADLDRQLVRHHLAGCHHATEFDGCVVHWFAVPSADLREVHP